MITVTREVLSEKEVRERLAALAHRYSLPDACRDESASDQMSDFDALKWLSLCDMLKAAGRRRESSSADDRVPVAFRSIYGMSGCNSEELENRFSLIDLAA
jgi:hypothetical protein